MTETQWTTFKLPKPFVKTIDKFIEKHRHEGYNTRADVIKPALREFMANKNNNGNNGDNE